jgi:phage protein D
MSASTSPLVGVPEFELTIGNAAIAPALKADIASVEVTEDVDMPAMLSVTLSLWDAQSQSLKEDYLTQFALGTPLELAIGDSGTTIFTGEVTALEPEFGGFERGDSLKVQAYNRLHRLQFGTYQRTFEKMTYSDIASSIAGELGLTGAADDSAVKHAHVAQKNVSNLAFLLDLARPINYEVLVEDKTLHFRGIKAPRGPAVTLTYRQDLVEFTPRQRSVHEGAKVEVRGWDVKAKKAILGSAGAGDETSKMGGDDTGAELSAAAFASATRTVTREPVVDADHATRIAKAAYNRQQSNFIEAQGECAGSTQIRAGNSVDIAGLGDAFSGTYYVVSATHTVGLDGYRTRFKVTRNAV